MKTNSAHGVLLLEKATGMSSHTAMQRAQRLMGVPKAGHTGSLDPLATGMLPICLGEATKFAQYWLEADKAYTVRLRFGVSTDSGDQDGQVVATAPVPPLDATILEGLLAPWRGVNPQVPPMYAALKHQGRPLYWFARQGVEIPREARMITIETLQLLDWNAEEATLFVACSKGTYIRSLVMDLGAALGCGAHVLQLHRNWVYPFEKAPMVSLEALGEMDMAARWAWVHATSAALGHIPAQELNPTVAARLYQGQRVPVPFPEGKMQLHLDGALIGMGEVRAGVLHPLRLFSTQDTASVETA